MTYPRLGIILYLVLTASLVCHGDNHGISPQDTLRAEMMFEFERQLDRPIHKLANHKFNSKSSMRDRIGPAPEVVLKPLRLFDERPDYRGYLPSEADKDLIMKAFETFPAIMQKRLHKVLCGIYVVHDFRGGGLTDWVEGGKQGHIYTFILINAKTLEADLATWWTKRLTTVKRQTAGPRVVVSASKQIPAVWHLIYHEAAHALDYTYGLTRFVEWYMPHGRAGVMDKGLINLVWKKRAEPKVKLIWQPHVKFYGFGKTRLASGALARVYRDLSKSPFVSLYGTQNWNEDVAELFSLTHLQKTHDLSITYRVMNEQKVLFEYKPLDNPKVKARQKGLTWFYASP